MSGFLSHSFLNQNNNIVNKNNKSNNIFNKKKKEGEKNTKNKEIINYGVDKKLYFRGFIFVFM